MPETTRWLYHILGTGEGHFDPYAPASFAKENFIHASFRPEVLESARRFFPEDAALEVLQIDPRRVAYQVVATDRGPMPHILDPIASTAIVRRFALEDIAAAPDVLSPVGAAG